MRNTHVGCTHCKVVLDFKEQIRLTNTQTRPRPIGPHQIFPLQEPPTVSPTMVNAQQKMFKRAPCLYFAYRVHTWVERGCCCLCMLQGDGVRWSLWTRGFPLSTCWIDFVSPLGKVTASHKTRWTDGCEGHTGVWR